MKIGILREKKDLENRVAIIPQFVKNLMNIGFEVFIEEGAGKKSYYENDEYKQNGANVTNTNIIFGCDVILKISPFEIEEIEKCRQNQVLITNMAVFNNIEVIKKIKEKNMCLLALDLLPRITRAQSMDVLSSQSNIAGYAAVMRACFLYPKIFPMMITAAGSIAPAKVFIMGVGVAGLSAIATAKRLGAVVSAYDVRPQTKEQVSSLGAKFLDINYKVEDKNLVYANEMSEEYKKIEEEAIIAHIKSQDVIVSSAMIMGKKAPILINENVFKNIKSGSVIVDMASENGGNCIYTVIDKTYDKNGVQIVGATNLSNDFPKDASFMYAKNIVNFLGYLVSDLKINILDISVNIEDEILSSVMVCNKGEVVSKLLKEVI